MNQSEKERKEEVLAELKDFSNSFQTMGVEHNFNENQSLEELENTLTMAQVFFENMATSVIGERDSDLEEVPVTVEILSEFARDISPEPEVIIQRINELATQPEDDLDESEKFEYSGLFETYEALGEQSLIMTTSDWDPSELVYLLNFMLKKLKAAEIDEDVVEEIEEKLLDFEDDYEEQEELVWHSIAKLLDERGFSLIQMTPIGGIWSDKALIIIKKEKANRWVHKAFGGYALSSFSDDYLELDW